MPKRAAFTKVRFILAEGAEDAQFARELIATRNLGDFDVSPTIDIGNKAGNSGFEEAVIACEPLTGFTAMTDVVILADNDDDPSASFNRVVDQIRKARADGNLTRNWGAASQSGIKAAGDPSVTIWMWPGAGQTGCLESLLWQVIEAKHPKEAKCVADAVSCSGADHWPISKLDKARVRCFVSLVCRRNPGIALANLWRDHPDLIPLNHPLFNPFGAFLAGI